MNLLVRITAIIIAAAMYSDLFAHGVEFKTSKNEAFTITLNYSDGEVMSYTPYKIYISGNKTVFQNGLTDKNGIVSFIPDSPGEWRVEVSDESGHGAVINVMVESSMKQSGVQTGSATVTQKIIMALCVIWGATGTALYFRRKV